MDLVKCEFDKYAATYDKYNIIQKIVSKALIRDIKNNPRTILDLGCGNGQVFSYINWNFDRYIGVDFSKKMCNLHPKTKKSKIYCLSFDEIAFFEKFKNDFFDIVISSSAMQWSKDLQKLVDFISTITNKFEGVLFTSNTYKSIFKIINKTSPILSIDQIKKVFDKYNAIYEVYEYKIEFTDKKDLFRYIKNSGTSGGIRLNFKEAKYLYLNYPHNFLEFEVVFIKTTF